jgi:hypothetical protein
MTGGRVIGLCRMTDCRLVGTHVGVDFGEGKMQRTLLLHRQFTLIQKLQHAGGEWLNTIVFPDNGQIVERAEIIRLQFKRS